MAEAELCVSTSRPLPKPKPAGSRWTLHAGERQVQEDRAPRVDSHSPRFNPQTYPLSFPSNASLLFVDPFVTAYIPRYYRRLPVCFSLSSGLGQCVLTAVSIDSAIVFNLRASIVHQLTTVCSVIYTLLPKVSASRSGSCSPHKRLTKSVALLRLSPICWASAPS